MYIYIGVAWVKVHLHGTRWSYYHHQITTCICQLYDYRIMHLDGIQFLGMMSAVSNCLSLSCQLILFDSDIFAPRAKISGMIQPSYEQCIPCKSSVLQTNSVSFSLFAKNCNLWVMVWPSCVCKLCSTLCVGILCLHFVVSGQSGTITVKYRYDVLWFMGDGMTIMCL